jgi:hypothetical protein
MATRIVIALLFVAYAIAQNCVMIVPANPLTANGLATPFFVVTGTCNQTNPGQMSFVQGAVISPSTGQISVYNPLAIQQGASPGS